MKKLLVLTALSFLSLQVQAIVDMRNANYSNTWTDLEYPGSGFDLRVLRTYNSRSLFNGMFGFGWCSDFETKVDTTAEGNLKITECGAGQELFFTSKDFSKNEIENTVKQIVDKVKVAKKLNDSDLKKFREELLVDANLRSRFAFSYKVNRPIKEGATYFSNGVELENIVFSKGVYTRTMKDGSSQRFDSNGRLTHLLDRNGNFLKFEYTRDLLKEAVDNNGRKLSFSFYNNKKIRSILGPNGERADYEFKNLDDLSVVRIGKSVHSYEYDDLHNMVKATWPDKSFVQIKYDKKKDWVLSFTDREKCLENYQYEFDKENPKLNYWATVKKTCGKEVVNESRHEFWYSARSDGALYLRRNLSQVNANSTDVIYHETFGKPVSIRRNGVTYSFEYFPTGLVKSKSSPLAKLSFKYDSKTDKVVEVISEALDAKGKVVETKKSTFEYDKKGNIRLAENTDGQRVNFTYDDKGRITVISDQSKKTVKVTYEERFGKPSKIERPGLGALTLTYKSNGEIDQAVSKEGSSVAMQIASMFNNLLDVTAPATAEIFN